MSTDSKWEKYSPFPSTFLTNPFMINENEFIAATSSLNDCIYTFDQHKNEWNKIFDSDTNFMSAVAYNKVNQVMYICSSKGITAPSLLTFDVKSRKLSTLIEMPSHNYQLIFVENKLHILYYDAYGGKDILSVYDNNMKQFNKIHQEQRFQLTECPLIYLESQKCLLSFGARVQNEPYNYSLYQFSFMDTKWTELNVKIPKGILITSNSLVKSKNEKYIIICGGRKGFQLSNDIFIYDTRKRLFTQSKMKCPKKGTYYGLMTNDTKRDEILCFGFVNDCYKGNNFKNVQSLPFYLVQIVNCYFSHEELHLFQRWNPGHWKINIDHILQC